jgi:hypothetical protein
MCGSAAAYVHSLCMLSCVLLLTSILVQRYKEKSLLRLQDSNSYVKAPHCYNATLLTYF